MKVLFLGTSSGKPSKYRNVTSIAVIMEDSNYCLIDCGEATQHQLIKSELKFNKLDSIFITHMHGDHIFGLPGLLCTLNEMRSHPLTIYGPKGISDYVEFVRRNITNYTLLINEIREEHKVITTINQKNYHYSVEACEVKHCNDPGIDCFAYKINKKRSNPKINISRLANIIDSHRTLLEKNGYIPAEKVISHLKKNINIDTPIKLHLSDFMINEEDYSLIIALDNYNSSKMVSEFRNCDALIHESTYISTDVNDLEIKKLAMKHGHSTNIMALSTAEKLNAKRLILTHFSNRYDPTEEFNQETQNICHTLNSKISVNCAKDFDLFSLE